jgi:hypothetical protein
VGRITKISMVNCITESQFFGLPILLASGYQGLPFLGEGVVVKQLGCEAVHFQLVPK